MKPLPNHAFRTKPTHRKAGKTRNYISLCLYCISKSNLRWRSSQSHCFNNPATDGVTSRILKCNLQCNLRYSRVLRRLFMKLNGMVLRVESSLWMVWMRVAFHRIGGVIGRLSRLRYNTGFNLLQGKRYCRGLFISRVLLLD